MWGKAMALLLLLLGHHTKSYLSFKKKKPTDLQQFCCWFSLQFVDFKKEVFVKSNPLNMHFTYVSSSVRFWFRSNKHSGLKKVIVLLSWKTNFRKITGTILNTLFSSFLDFLNHTTVLCRRSNAKF